MTRRSREGREVVLDVEVQTGAQAREALDAVVSWIRAVGARGVDVISVGALTYSAPAVDLSMLLTAS